MQEGQVTTSTAAASAWQISQPGFDSFKSEFEEVDNDDDDDDDNPHSKLRPWWKLTRFEDAAVENAYRKWHLRLWMPRLQVMYVLTAIVYGGGFLNQFLAAKDSLKFILNEMRPNLSRAMIVLTVIARAIPCVLGIFVCVPVTRKLITANRYQSFVFMTYLVPMLIEQAWPVLAPGWYTPMPNVSATPRFQEWLDKPSVTIRQTFYHAALCDLYNACLGTLSGLFPESVLLIGTCATLLNHLQFSNTWRSLDYLRSQLDGTDPVAADEMNGLWLFRFMTLVWSVAISVLLDRGQRKEFFVRLQLRRAKDLRIEQLKQEKEHLDWDRKLARAPTQPLDALDPRMADASSASCAELEMVLPQLDPLNDPHAHRPPRNPYVDGGGGACGSAACGGAARQRAASAGGPMAVSVGSAPLASVRLTEELNWEETRRLRAAGLRRPRSDVSSSDGCSSLSKGGAELDGGGAELDSAIGHTCAVRESALWRTLRRTGLVSPAPSSVASSAMPEAELAANEQLP